MFEFQTFAMKIDVQKCTASFFFELMIDQIFANTSLSKFDLDNHQRKNPNTILMVEIKWDLLLYHKSWVCTNKFRFKTDLFGSESKWTNSLSVV